MNSINQTNIHDIIERYGNSEGNTGISIDFGNDNVEMLIISLIVDDGRKQRKNRKMMFNDNYNKIGCSSKVSKFHKNISVILYAIDFNKKSFNNNKINYVNENVVGLDPRIDLFTDSAKMNLIIIIIILKEIIMKKLEMIVIIMIILVVIFIKLIKTTLI